MGTGHGKQQSAGAFGEMIAARGGIDVVSKMAVVQFERSGGADAQADSPGHAKRRRGATGAVMPQHPVVVGGRASEDAVARFTSARGCVEKLVELIAGNAGEPKRVLAGEGIVAGRQEVVDPLRVGLDELQVAVSQRAGFEELKGVREQVSAGYIEKSALP